MSKIEKINPCPFCGHMRPFFYGEWRIECRRCGCGTEGPEASSEQEAIAWWNEVPRLSDRLLKSRRSRWVTMQRRDMRAAKKRVAEFEGATKRERDKIAEDRRWVQQRNAWLNAPVGTVGME